MKMNGGVARADLGAENVAAVQAGCANLGRHIENLKSFGVPVVVAINHFLGDTDAEVAALQEYVAEQGSEAIISRHWELGGKVPRRWPSGSPRSPIPKLAISRRSILMKCHC